MIDRKQYGTFKEIQRLYDELVESADACRLDRYSDLGKAGSMIPLGSCTIKLNETKEMMPVTWPASAGMHLFAPTGQAEGYQEMFKNLGDMLCTITGFDSSSLQSNASAAGEYTGLMVIYAYHMARGDHHRNVRIIPVSAHGTNPASAACRSFLDATICVLDQLFSP